MRTFLWLWLLVTPLAVSASLPPFSAQDVDGEHWDTARLDRKPLTILVFFSTSCKICGDMIETLQGLDQDGVFTLAVSTESMEKLKQFSQQREMSGPVLHAKAEVLKGFRALGVYPTVYVVGPEHKVLDHFQGSVAKGQELWLIIADRLMQRKSYSAAASLYKRVDAAPYRDRAQLGLGYSLLKQGESERARQIFESLLSSPMAAGAWEGLAELRLDAGDLEAAAAAVGEVLALDPRRPVAKSLEARIRFRRGQLAEAERDIQQAAKSVSKADFTWQKADTLIVEGNLARRRGKPKLALASYEKASKVTPLAVEAVSNQAVVMLEDLKHPEEAVKTLEKAQRLDPRDALIRTLLIQAREAKTFQQDMERRRYVQKLVRELAERYRQKRAQEPARPEDDWTSPPLALSVLDFRNRSPSLVDRIGVEKALRDALIDQLRQRGMVVVEREVLDNLLEELNLGSSALADPEVQLRLGKVMSARLLALGTLSPKPKKGLSFLRLIETETTQIVSSLSQPLPRRLDPMALAGGYADDIQKIIHEHYPLRGRIALVEKGQVAINLGRKHGVKPGMVFNVLSEGEPIELNGRILGYRRKVIGKVRIVEVKEGFSMAAIINSEAPLAQNQKIEISTGAL